MKQTSMVLEEIGKFSARQLDIPAIGSDEALLRVEMTGVCRTDASFYQGKTRPHLIPLILGHEILGHIAEIGEQAARNYGVQEGDRVVVESSIRCDRCPYCRQGNYQLCDNYRSYGTSMTLSTPPHLWGAYGEYLYLAPGSVLHPIAESVPAEAAVLACSVIADGIQWVRDMGQVQPGDTVLVQGAGQQGLAAAVAARECDAGQIIVTGLSRDERRLELAQKLGASHTINVEQENLEGRLRELTNDTLADVVVDVSTSLRALAQAGSLVRKGGTVVVASVVGEKTTVPINTDQLVFKQVTVKYVYTSTAPAVRSAVQLIESRKYPFEEMVTHRFPLEQAEQAVQAVAGQNAKVYPIKVVLTQ
jgi:alcohol dehydrogenase